MRFMKVIDLVFGYVLHAILCGLLFRFLSPVPCFVITGLVFGAGGAKLDQTEFVEFIFGSLIYIFLACLFMVALFGQVALKQMHIGIVVIFAALPLAQTMLFATGYLVDSRLNRGRKAK